MKRLFIAVVAAVGIFFISGCANMMTNTTQYKGSGNLLLKRDVAAVITKIEAEKEKTYKEKDRVLEYLDLGMLYHYQGDFVKSNLLLEQAETSMEELYTKSIANAAMSMLLNDNALDYFGEDYEDVYTNVFKALNYLHQDDFDAAFVEIRRINLKLGMLEDKYQKVAKSLNASKEKKTDITAGVNKFTNSALGRYLSMIIYEQEGKKDDAHIDFTKIAEAFDSQPDIYPFSPPDLSDPLNQLNQPSLHIISLIGKSPYKRSKELHIATAKDQITIVAVDKSIDAVNLFWPGVEPNYYFKFAIPYIVNDETEVNKVVLKIDDQSFELAKLEDIGNVAVQTFKVKEPIIFLKSVTRSVLKGIVTEQAKAEMKKKNPGFGGDLMALAADAALFASENADLRTSRFFPNQVLIGDIPVTEGEHNIAVEYYHRNGNLLYRDNKGLVNISKDKLNLIESWQIQ